MTRKEIKAVWVLSEFAAMEISHRFTSTKGIWVAIDKEEEYWFGSWNRGMMIPEIGTIIAMNPIDKRDVIKEWEMVRQHFFFNNKGGPPSRGQSLHFGNNLEAEPQKTQDSNECNCSLEQIMEHGCPSNKGYKCPSI